MIATVPPHNIQSDFVIYVEPILRETPLTTAMLRPAQGVKHVKRVATPTTRNLSVIITSPWAAKQRRTGQCVLSAETPDIYQPHVRYMKLEIPRRTAQNDARFASKQITSTYAVKRTWANPNRKTIVASVDQWTTTTTFVITLKWTFQV